MNTVSYKKNYLLIYFWQTLSILLGFLSLFIVIPFLSSDKALYGIYSICTSLTIFFSYADLGFIPAGIKYAAEYYIRGEKDNEIRMIGFVAFIMMITFLITSFFIIICAISPNLLIPELVENSSLYITTRYLLIILAFSCPIIIGQRILMMIFSIRVEDYKYQRISIVGSLIKILSVFYFFRSGSYEVVGYFTFFQIVNLLIVITAFIYVRRYGYNLRRMWQSFHFDKQIFNKVKRLSATSLILSIAMVLYYELDQIVIANLFGIESVATYAIALSVMAFVRTFMSLLYSPYISRYNHYIGSNNITGINDFLKKNILFLAPFVCCPIIILSISSYPFIYSWVGESYSSSALLVSIMVLSFIPNFIRTPITSYFVAIEDNRSLIRLNLLIVFVYWTGIIVCSSYIGLYAFAIFKVIAPFTAAIGYWYITYWHFKNNGFAFVKLSSLMKVLATSIPFAILSSYLALNFMKTIYSETALLTNLLIMGCCLISSIVFFLILNRQALATIRRLFTH